MIGINRLLLNTLVIIVSIFIYQIFWLDRDNKQAYNNSLISALTCIATVLCVTFPFRHLSHCLFDLQAIPIILSFLYGGYGSLFFVSVVYLDYRYHLDAHGFSICLLVHIAMVVILLLVNHLLPSSTKLNRMALAISTATVWSTLFISLAIWQETKHHHFAFNSKAVQFLIAYIFINTLTMWLSVHLIEEAIEKWLIKNEFRRAEKMSALGELSASFAHEIRNPLTTVHGFLQLFAKHQVSDEKKDEYVQVMLSELETALSRIADYLYFAKPEKEKTQPVDINLLVQHAIDATTPLAQVNGVQIYGYASECCYFNANPARVKQCLLNLMKNGIEAMANGGKLEIYTKQEENNMTYAVAV